MLTVTLQRIHNATQNYLGADRWVGTGRSLIAIAQLTVLCFTPTRFLFVPIAGETPKPQCDGWKSLTAYCLGNEESRPWITVLLIAILLLVIVGIFPALTAVPHYWATISISTGISLPDGGEAAAQVITLFLVFLLIGDRRRSHWDSASLRTAPQGPMLGFTWAAHWVIRLQMAWIYINAAIPKLSVQEWKDGTAIYYVTRGEFFGAPTHLQNAVHWVTSVPWLELSLTWGTIATELAIAYFLLFGKNRFRLVSLGLCVALHVGIIIVIGLWSFALVMIGGVVAAMAGTPAKMPTIAIRTRVSEVPEAPTTTIPDEDAHRVRDERLTTSI
ncbi:MULTISPECIES: sporulation-delaying protein SdpB family protein [Glutamicibacter]|uniref:sporulation-delaying protein SdpB family protein n=1 Tax=Glutamicibacter TaxID=1742989 RepID=UPI001959663F|nr:sporulation-delaying protein SdpB family protein [Glutamicibacter nicotianae]MBM7769771.1 antimicrobial peptide system SdpB family protein [Glutamicibacter nicotianae]